ncbi:MAG: hypothetical protein ACLPJJ_01660 [Acidocella sp.]|uniref:hypothetical protein n=1 Tax=Acidocella sp. TaxID=50710 RepID=UPI003FD753CD
MTSATVSGAATLALGTIIAAETLANYTTLLVPAGETMVSPTLGYDNLITVEAAGVVTSPSLTNTSDTIVVLTGGQVLDPYLGWNSTINVDGGLVSGAVTESDNVQQPNPLLIVSAGGLVSTSTLNAGSDLEIDFGGTAMDNQINYAADILIYTGGTANDTTLKAGAAELIYAGGADNNATLTGGLGVGTTVNLESFSEAQQDVLFGGLANDAVVGTAGEQFVFDGGTATGTTLLNGGLAFAYDGSTLIDLNVESGGTALLNDGASLVGASVAAGGLLVEMPGAVAASVNGAGEIVTAGVVVETMPSYADVKAQVNYLGVSASSNWIGAGQEEYVLPGGTLSNAGVAAGGTLTIFSGGTVATGWISGLAVVDGGTASGLNLTGGDADVIAGQADGTAIGVGATLVVDGGLASGTNIDPSGTEIVISDAIGGNIWSGGLLEVQAGGFSSGIVIQGGGLAIVAAGGTMTDTSLVTGGFLVAMSGATVDNAGAIDFNGGVLALNEAEGSFTSTASAGDLTIGNGQIDLIGSATAGTVTVTDGGTLMALAGATMASVILDGGILDVTDSVNIGSVTIEVGTPGSFTNDASVDVSALLNAELASVPDGVSITVDFNPGDYGLASTVLLPSDVTVTGTDATVGALNDNVGALFENANEYPTGFTYTLANATGGFSTIANGGGLANVDTVYSDGTLAIYPEFPIRTTTFSSYVPSIVTESNITIEGMTFAATGNIVVNGTTVAADGTMFGNATRASFFNDLFNVDIQNNVFIGGSNAVAMVNTENVEISGNLAVGAGTGFDNWSGPSNLNIADNEIWLFNEADVYAGGVAVQIDANAQDQASDPGVNSNGTAVNNGVIDNLISGSATAAALATQISPLFPYGITTLTSVTQQGNIDNALGATTGGYYSADVYDAIEEDNVLAQSAGNTDLGIWQALGISGGDLIGNLVLDQSASTSGQIIGIDDSKPYAVDNAVINASTFDETAAGLGAIVISGSLLVGSGILSALDIGAPPDLVLDSTGGTIALDGTLAPFIIDSLASDRLSITLTTQFGSLVTVGSLTGASTATVNGETALILTGDLDSVNQDLAQLGYAASSSGQDDNIEITVTDLTAQLTDTRYIPVLFSDLIPADPSGVTTLAAGFIAPPGSTGGVTLTGETMIDNGGSNTITMGSLASLAFLGNGQTTLLGGSLPEDISTGVGSATLDLLGSGDITVAGGAGGMDVDAKTSIASVADLIEAGTGDTSITAGAGAMTVIGGLGNMTYQGGQGTTYLTTLPADGGALTADLGSGDATVFALSGADILTTEVGTSNLLYFGLGGDTVAADGADLVIGNTLTSNGDDSISSGAGGLLITAGASAQDSINAGIGGLVFEGASDTAPVRIVSSQADALGASITLGSGGGVITLAGGLNFIQTGANASTSMMLGGQSWVDSNGDDAITVTGSATINAGAQARDTINAASGDVVYNASLGGSVIFKGGSGADTVNLGASAGTVMGGSGTVEVQATDDDFQITLGAGSYSLDDMPGVNRIAGSYDTVVAGGDTGVNTLFTEAGGSADLSITGGAYVLNMMPNGIMLGTASVDLQSGALTVDTASGLATSDITIAGSASLQVNGQIQGNYVDPGMATVSGLFTSATLVTGQMPGISADLSGSNDHVNLAGGINTVSIFSGNATINATDNATVSVFLYGTSTLDFINGSSAAQTVLAGGGGAVTAFGGMGGGLYVGSSTGNNSLTGGSGLVTLVGGGNGDVLTATGNGLNSLPNANTRNILYSGAGNETLLASSATGSNIFYISADAGNDMVSTAGAGEQTFFLSGGTACNTTITGAAAGSLYNVYDVSNAGQSGGSYTITNFDSGAPSIIYLINENHTGNNSIPIVGATNQSNGVLITLGNSTTITLLGVNTSDLHYFNSGGITGIC